MLVVMLTGKYGLRGDPRRAAQDECGVSGCAAHPGQPSVDRCTKGVLKTSIKAAVLVGVNSHNNMVTPLMLTST